MDLASMGIGAAVKAEDDSYTGNRFSAIVAAKGGCTVSFRSYARNGNYVVWTAHEMDAGEFIVGDIRQLDVTAGAAVAYFQPNNLSSNIT
jgi:hypothetical protein